MGQLKGTLKRVSCCALALVLMSTTVGCSIADRLRPDLNFGSDIHLIPNESAVPNDDVMPGSEVAVWPNGSPYSPSYSYAPHNPTIVTENFETFQKDTIADEDYVTYLTEQVYEKLKSIINGLDPDIAKQVYLRCGHAGYNISGLNPEPHKGAGCDLKHIDSKHFSTNRPIGGDTLIPFAVDWLGHLKENTEHKDTQIRAAQGQIKFYATPEDMSKSWYELSGSTLPTSYYRLFGREDKNFKTLQEYYDAIATDPYRNIPNYSLYMKSGETTVNTLTFNKVSTSISTPYEPGISPDTMDKLFRKYNQYDTRSRDAVYKTNIDDSSILRYYIDGYNKTLIFIATTEGTNLKELVGDKAYEQINEIINGAYNCTQCTEITSIKPTDPDPTTPVDPSAPPATPTGPDYSGFRVIPAGSKGVD